MPAVRARAYNFFGVAALLAVALGPRPAQALERSVLEVDTYRLDNGLTVVLAPHRLAPVVAMQAWVGAGSADEPAARAGIAHVVEHMLFKGTAQRGVGGLSIAIEAAGGDLNAWTSFDETVIHAVVARRAFEVGMDVLGDAVCGARLDADEFERERQVVLEEIRQGQDDPVKNVARAVFESAFVVHPYRRPVIGSAATVRKLRHADIVDFYRGYYVAGNTTVIVTGDFDEAAARRSIDRHFGRMASGGPRRRPVREPAQVAPRGHALAQDVHDAYVAIGFPVPRLGDGDGAALDLAAVLLGQGGSSRLERRVQREAELVSGVWAYQHLLRDAGLFVVSATAKPAAVRPAIAAISGELARLADDLGTSELDKAKAAIEADAIYQLETAQGVARKLGWWHTSTGDARGAERHAEQVRTTTVAQVRAVVRKHLDIERANLAAVVPTSAARGARGRAALGRALIAHARRGAKVARRAPAAPAPLAVVRTVLANGMVVLVKPDPSVPVVAMRAVWPGGVRLEDDQTNGVTALLAQWITRGCGDRDPASLTEMIDRIGGGLAGAAGRNSFGLRAEWLARTWDQGLDLLADCVLTPRFDPAELAGERRRLLDELAGQDDSASHAAFRLFAQALYQTHPYRLDVMGSAGAVGRLEADQVAAFYRDHFPVSGLTLAIVGDVDPDQVIARVRARFEPVPRAIAVAPSVAPERFAGRAARSREVYRFLEREQAHLVIGFPGTTVGSPDRFALEVLVGILGGQSGRLFAEVRDHLGLAYRVSAHSVEGLDPGYLAIYLSCAPANLDAATAAVDRELDRLVADGVTDDEVARVVTYLTGAHDVALQRRSAVATALAFHEAYGLGWAEWSRYPERIAQVTAADVTRVARQYLRDDLAITATVRPPALSPAVAKRKAGKRPAAPVRHPHPPARSRRTS